MTKPQIRLSSHNEQVNLSNQQNNKRSFTALVLLSQEVLQEDSWASIEIINEPDPFDYDPFSMED